MESTDSISGNRLKYCQGPDVPELGTKNQILVRPFITLVLKIFKFFLQNLVSDSILIKNVKKILNSVHNFSLYINVFSPGFWVFSRASRAKTPKNQAIKRPKPNLIVVCKLFGCSNPAGRDEVCKLLWYA